MDYLRGLLLLRILIHIWFDASSLLPFLDLLLDTNVSASVQLTLFYKTRGYNEEGRKGGSRGGFFLAPGVSLDTASWIVFSIYTYINNKLSENRM